MPKKAKVTQPCLCLCGQLTGKLYYPGCDQKVRICLANDMVDGISEAAKVQAALASKRVSDADMRRTYAEYHAKYHG
jgi:hypothetical protein